MSEGTREALRLIWDALGGAGQDLERVEVAGEGQLRSAFAVSDLAGSSVGAAALAAAEHIGLAGGTLPTVSVDRRLSSFWFARSIRPQGWQMAAPWDAVAGDYETSDGWIRLHTNATHHRAAALAVLGTPADREAVAHAVGRWRTEALEAAIVARGGCAAAMRSAEAWAAHPQGAAVAAEPLVHVEVGSLGLARDRAVPSARPLQGVRVLDLTRVLAGPVATRFLAGLGADVLRIDPPDWDEPGVVPDVVLGKTCARLDLRSGEHRATFEALLRGADVLVHGYRPDALAGLGLGSERRAALSPGLVDVTLDAYGWTGPWRGRRGFDSLVQMSAGIAEAGMRRFGTDRPTPLPVQSLDHATGYILAAAALRGLTQRARTGAGSTWRASLARTAALLMGLPPTEVGDLAPETSADVAGDIEATSWGSARRLDPPCRIEGASLAWDRPATALGSAAAAWAP